MITLAEVIFPPMTIFLIGLTVSAVYELALKYAYEDFYLERYGMTL
jgi:hypothetical protein